MLYFVLYVGSVILLGFVVFTFRRFEVEVDGIFFGFSFS